MTYTDKRAFREGRLAHLIVIVLSIALGAFTLTSCAGADEQGSPAHRVQTWVVGTGFANSVGTLRADSTRIETVINEHHGSSAISTDCSVLVTDASAANDELPTPDPKLTGLLSRAYALEGSAGTKCYAAGAANKSLLEQSANDRSAANKLLNDAVARIVAITGKTVSTTTTTQPSSGGIFG
ncbi:MAG: hypothetical protein ACYDEP_00665 [Acidimicrobiales bacterium]|jgi:hypothetical protein